MIVLFSPLAFFLLILDLMSAFKSRRSKCFPKKFPARKHEDIAVQLFDYGLVEFQKIINFLSQRIILAIIIAVLWGEN